MLLPALSCRAAARELSSITVGVTMVCLENSSVVFFFFFNSVVYCVEILRQNMLI